MNRRYLVAVSAAISSSAYAQSSVTLYGLISDGVEYVSNETGKSNVKLFGGALNDSRWGFQVIEGLGGGLSAVATLENGFDINTGKFRQGGLEFGRQAFVGLSDTRLGTITFGRQYDVNHDFLSPLLPASAGNGLGDNIGDNDDVFWSFRYNNSVKYVSPTLKGIWVEGLYAFSNEAGRYSQNRAASAGIGYANGTLSLAATFVNIDQPGTANPNGAVTTDYAPGSSLLFHTSPLNTAVGVDRQRIYGIGGAYKFGLFKLSLMTTDVRFNYLDHTSLHLDNCDGTLSYLVTPSLSLAGSYLYTRGQYGGLSTNTGVHWNTGQLSADYLLSKLTDLFIYSDLIRASGPRSVAVTFGSGQSTSSSQAIVMAGIRHKF